MLISELRVLKEKAGKTNEEIAKMTGISLSTVQRIFSGETEDPRIDNVCAIVRALGGSLDKILGIPVFNDTRRDDAKIYNEVSAMQDFMERSMQAKDLWIKRMFSLIKWLIGVIVAMFVLFLIYLVVFDSQIGTAGLIRY